MIFTYKKWNELCEKLDANGLHSITARQVDSKLDRYIVLKHDVETDINKALDIAKIENKYGHCGSYYVQAYLLNKDSNIDMLKEIQSMGHEVSYHYDVMDSSKGDLEKAILEFEANMQLFENNGFELQTLCQHGNPVIERIGYTSNRDFFRSKKVQSLYPNICDIMVNYKDVHQTEYLYYSDAGKKIKHIYDPINNDIVNSDDKNKSYDNLNLLFEEVINSSSIIISIHPHRWTKSATSSVLKTAIFKIIRFVAIICMKIPVLKKIMSRYYYLAKKL